jgi:hypothetical protein
VCVRVFIGAGQGPDVHTTRFPVIVLKSFLIVFIFYKYK